MSNSPERGSSTLIPGLALVGLLAVILLSLLFATYTFIWWQDQWGAAALLLVGALTAAFTLHLCLRREK